MESVQSYDEGGWKYKDELARFVERGMQGTSFIDAVSGIVNRGCHNPVSSYVVFFLGDVLGNISLSFHSISHDSRVGQVPWTEVMSDLRTSRKY